MLVWQRSNAGTSSKLYKFMEKYLPDYELVLWNEDNFDINCNKYVKEAYESKYAFVTGM